MRPSEHRCSQTPAAANRLRGEPRGSAAYRGARAGARRVGPQRARRGPPARLVDRLIHDRERAEALFGFRYRLEMYVPTAKREYGYYVLPLLVGDRLVGRAEPRFDRKTRRLELLGAWGDTSRLDEAMAGLAEFLGAGDIV